MAFLDFLRSRPKLVPTPAATTGGSRRFAADRSRLFNLDQTRRLVALFGIAEGNRNDAWLEEFYDAAWYASISVPDPAYFDGPDGFPYWRLNIPRENTAFESQSLGNLARGCVERNAGAAFFENPDDPETLPLFVLSMGLLDSLLRYDSALGDPLDRAEAGEGHNSDIFDVKQVGAQHHAMTAKAEHQVMTGSPNADFLPPYTARALHRYMTRIWGIEDPRVHLLIDRNMRPSRNLVIGRKHSSFASEDEIAGEMRRLFWFLPRYRTVVLMPDDWKFEKMDRLEDLF